MPFDYVIIDGLTCPCGGVDSATILTVLRQEFGVIGSNKLVTERRILNYLMMCRKCKGDCEWVWRELTEEEKA